MTFKVDVEKVDAVHRRLAVEVPAEDVSAEIEKAYAEFSRVARIRGFRPGHVPRSVLERLFGDRLRAEVFERLIQESYSAVIEERQIVAVGRAEIVTEQAQPGAALRYSATVEVKPEVVAEHYTGLEVERPVTKVAEADVDAFVERVRQSFARLHPISDRTHVEAGDVVTLDYQARVGKRLVGRGENRQVEIGANGFPPEFDQRLVGAPASGTLDFPITYPSGEGTANLGGQTVQFYVHLRALSRKEVPPLDDEFAKDYGECSTLAELRERVRARLEADAARRADEVMRHRLVAQLAASHDIAVPEAMVQRRTDLLMQDVWREPQQLWQRPKDMAEAKARLREKLTPRAHQQVKIALLLEAIARQEGLRVNDEELNERIATLAREAGAAAERVRALYHDPAARQELRARMLQARAIDVVAERARVKTVETALSIAEAEENG
ncbi:MAG: trigger factor [Candidatus Binatia bacterium]